MSCDDAVRLAKPWQVRVKNETHSLVEGFAFPEAAEMDCKKRNERAIQLNLKTRYEFGKKAYFDAVVAAMDDGDLLDDWRPTDDES